MLTISVDVHRFEGADQVATVADQVADVVRPILLTFLVGQEQFAEEILLALRASAEVARQSLLPSEVRLISAAAAFVRVEIGHRAERIENRLTLVASAAPE